MSDTTNTAFSYKQELIQLHQVLAEARIFCKKEFGADTNIENLDEYSSIGITSINLNADIDKQLNAVLALSNELADVLSSERTEERTTATAETETIATTLFDVTEDGVAAEPQEATVEHQPNADAEQTVTADATDEKRYVDGEDVDMIDTSILASWSDVREEEQVSADDVETVNPDEWEYDSEKVEQTAEKKASMQETVNAY